MAEPVIDVNVFKPNLFILSYFHCILIPETTANIGGKIKCILKQHDDEAGIFDTIYAFSLIHVMGCKMLV